MAALLGGTAWVEPARNNVTGRDLRVENWGAAWVFVYRNAPGHGPNNWKGVTLRWLHVTDGVTDPGAAEQSDRVKELAAKWEARAERAWVNP